MQLDPGLRAQLEPALIAHFEGTHQPVLLVGGDGVCVGATDGIESLLGRSAAECVGCPLDDLFVEHTFDPVAMQVHPDRHRPWTMACRGGEPIRLTLACAPVACEAGPLAALTLIDVSEPVDSVEAAISSLTASEHLMSEVFEQAIGGMLLLNSQTHTVVRANPAMCALLDLERGEIEGRAIEAVFAELELARQLSDIMRALDEGAPQAQKGVRIERPGGRSVDVGLSACQLEIEHDALVLVMAHDITLYRQAMRAVVDWQQRYSAAVRATKLVLFEWYPAPDRLGIGEGAKALLKLTEEALPGSLVDWLLLVHPEDRNEVRQAFEACQRSGQAVHLDYRVSQGEGRWITVRHDADLVLDRKGSTRQLVGFLSDISRQQELESHLQQSTKMEAVGRLAGGVAHDFNNLLTSILSYTELAIMITNQTQVRDDLVKVVRSAQAASKLTQSLLTFSRRQVVTMAPLDLNAVISDTLSLVIPMVGENVTVVEQLAPTLYPIYADNNLLKQILMNLMVNARDAMGEGGRIVLTTSMGRDAAGALEVRLSVSDDGEGMSPEVQAQIFEPFFTTKPQGEGTGLGLSTVYGAVTQCRGTIAVESAPQMGTTFTLAFPAYVPLSPPRPQAVEMTPPPHPVAGAKGVLSIYDSAETPEPLPGLVLVVEDDAPLRELVRRVLEDSSHQVVAASGFDEALRLAEGKPLKLLLTDVVMPGKSGIQLARHLRDERPELPVLFMSGYPGEIIHSHGPLPEGAPLLSKPFTPAQLARAVRRVLRGDSL